MTEEYPGQFISLQLHISDEYQTEWTADRASFYGATGTPITWFDGVSEASGAITEDTGMYKWYESYVLNRLDTPTDVSVTLSAKELSSETYRLTVRVALDDDGVARRLLGNVVQVIDHYPPSDDSNYRNCVITHQDIAPFQISPGEALEFEIELTLEGESWDNREETRFVAWVAEPSTSGPAEVFNAAELAWPFDGTEPDTTCNLLPAGTSPWSGVVYLIPALAVVVRRRRRSSRA